MEIWFADLYVAIMASTNKGAQELKQQQQSPKNGMDIILQRNRIRNSCAISSLKWE